jgi:DNA-binding response OmpR family regulator
MKDKSAARIMIIDDDPTMIVLLRTLLEMEGFEVRIWTEDEPVLDSIRLHKPKVILLDVFLKDLDGFDILRQIRSQPDMQGKHIIMSSGMDYEDKCLRNGADAFLLKPYMPDDLLSLIRRQQFIQ